MVMCLFTLKMICQYFMRVQENTKVTVEVSVDFLNKEKCPGIKQGGVLNLVRRFVELTCKANKIPEKIEKRPTYKLALYSSVCIHVILITALYFLKNLNIIETFQDY